MQAYAWYRCALNGCYTLGLIESFKLDYPENTPKNEERKNNIKATGYLYGCTNPNLRDL
jgi:hypothetical protein